MNAIMSLLCLFLQLILVAIYVCKVDGFIASKQLNLKLPLRLCENLRFHSRWKASPDYAESAPETEKLEKATVKQKISSKAVKATPIPRSFSSGKLKPDSDSDSDSGNAVVRAKRPSKRGTMQEESTGSVYALSQDQSSPSMSDVSIPYAFFARIEGEPRPLLRHRISRGCMYNPSGLFQKAFHEACKTLIRSPPLQGPLEAHLHFFFSRPKSHYSARSKFSESAIRPSDFVEEGKLYTLKETAPQEHISRKDLDNLIKFVLDALNGKLYEDDCQVTQIIASKRYSATKTPIIEIGFKPTTNLVVTQR